LNKILEIVNQIAATSGRNEKEAILDNNRGNPLLRTILQMVYNPYVLTGISTKKISKKVKIPANVEFKDVPEFLTYFDTNFTGTDQDIANVQNFISKFSPDIQELLKQIVTKSLKIGATDGTANKVFGTGFIPSFDVMLAKKYFENEHKVKGKFILTEKLDGIRCILIKENGTVKMFSRQGQPHEGFVEIEAEAMNLPDGIVLDGEFILVNENDLNSADLYRETVKVARKDGEKRNIVFHVFDSMGVEAFRGGVSHQPCMVRKSTVGSVLKDNMKFIKEVPILYVGYDKEVIPELLDKVIAEGKEGLMLNLYDAPYECKRSGNILKIKRMQTVDLRVTGFEEGTGKYIGKLGRMNVDYKGYECGVGSGFADADRTEIWDNQEEYVGKIAEIQYFEESSNQNGGISLRFPVFKCWRDDKTEPSYD
jgi:DNA ligase 1